jgi:hypothetical protein
MNSCASTIEALRLKPDYAEAFNNRFILRLTQVTRGAHVSDTSHGTRTLGQQDSESTLDLGYLSVLTR